MKILVMTPISFSHALRRVLTKSLNMIQRDMTEYTMSFFLSSCSSTANTLISLLNWGRLARYCCATAKNFASYPCKLASAAISSKVAWKRFRHYFAASQMWDPAVYTYISKGSKKYTWRLTRTKGNSGIPETSSFNGWKARRTPISSPSSMVSKSFRPTKSHMFSFMSVKLVAWKSPWRPDRNPTWIKTRSSSRVGKGGDCGRVLPRLPCCCEETVTCVFFQKKLDFTYTSSG